MTDGKPELTRRKILGSMGAVGAAGAAAGFGTTALFSDEESFVNNSITAGTLDMVVDWEEHYSFPQLYDLGDPTDGIDATRSEPSDPSGYTAFPPGVEASEDFGVDADPLLWVDSDDVDAYMDDTSIEALPDEDDDGIQDDFNEDEACEELVDVGDGSNGLSDSARTDNAATDPGDPLVELGDVKPGDFGEVTLSFHLCDNPGYVWLNGDLRSDEDNGQNDPELNIGNDDSGSDGELLENIQTAWWYDENCDNLTDGSTGGTTDVDLMIVMDTSGSMGGGPLSSAKSGAKTLVDAVGSSVNVGLVSFEDDGDEATEATLADSNSAVKTAIDNLSAGGSTAIGAGIDLGQDNLDGTAGSGARSGANKVLVVLADGGENEFTTPRDSATNAKSAGTEIYSIAYGTGADNDLMEDISTNPTDDGTIDDQDPYAFTASQADIDAVFGDIGGQVTMGEEVFFVGPLGDALAALSSGDGIPLDGDGGNDFDEFNDPADADSRGCFEPTPNTNCIGFSWWVPTEVGNEIQSDSVSFDLGFYAEQCRNNDGDGDPVTQTPGTT